MTEKLDASQVTISDLKNFKFTLESSVQTKEHEKLMMENELKSLQQARGDLIAKHDAQMEVAKNILMTGLEISNILGEGYFVKGDGRNQEEHGFFTTRSRWFSCRSFPVQGIT
jgi:hypothetical protein